MSNEEKYYNVTNVVKGNQYNVCNNYIWIDNKQYKLTSGMVNILLDLFSAKFKKDVILDMNFFATEKETDEQKIEKIDKMISDILHLSVFLSAPFKIYTIRKIKFLTKNNDEIKQGKSGEEQDGQINKLFNDIKELLIKENPDLKGKEEILKETLTELLTYNRIDEFGFDIVSVYRKIIKSIKDGLCKGYNQVLENLRDIYNFLVGLKKNATEIDFFHKDLLTPEGLYFKFAIFDCKGQDVAYMKNNIGEEGIFEFFVERKDALGYYDICCVIRDWNLAFANCINLKNESEYNEEITAYLEVVDENIDNFIKKYPLIKYTQCQIIWDDDTIDRITYKKYTQNGGKILLKGNVSNFKKTGVIKFCNPRKQSTSPYECEFHFHIIFGQSTKNEYAASKQKASNYKGISESIKKRYLRCPYCGRELKFYRWSKKRGRYCNGEKVKKADNYAKLEDVQKRGTLCRYNHYLDSSSKSANEFPDNPLVLPKNFMKCNNGVIQLVGMPESGKSIFLSKLFGFDQGGYSNPMPNWNRTISPFINNSTVMPFTPLSGKKGDWLNAQNQSSYSASYANYVSKLYDKMAKRTLRNSLGFIMQLPFIMEMSNINNHVSSFLSFFDCPGEYLCKVEEDGKITNEVLTDPTAELYPIFNSDGYILFVDLQDITNGFNRATQILKIISENLKKINERKPNTKGVLAVVFAKLDVLIEALRMKLPDEAEEKFLSVVCRAAPLESRKCIKFESSSTAKFIDECSNAIEEYFEIKHEDQFASLKSQIFPDLYGEAKFFALTALGRDSSIQPIVTGDAPKMLYKTKSNYNVDLVVLWLAVKLGMIR